MCERDGAESEQKRDTNIRENKQRKIDSVVMSLVIASVL